MRVNVTFPSKDNYGLASFLPEKEKQKEGKGKLIPKKSGFATEGLMEETFGLTPHFIVREVERERPFPL